MLQKIKWLITRAFWISALTVATPLSYSARLDSFIFKILPLSLFHLQLNDSKKSICKELKKVGLITIKTDEVLPIFKKDGSLQCEPLYANKILSEQTMKESLRLLKEKDITVFKSTKGTLITGRGLSVCGSPTNNINIFYVSSKKIKEAVLTGFKLCYSE